MNPAAAHAWSVLEFGRQPRRAALNEVLLQISQDLDKTIDRPDGMQATLRWHLPPRPGPPPPSGPWQFARGPQLTACYHRSATSSVYCKNCTAARPAGVTPIYRGEPGYAPHLDRDNDGIAYE